MGLQRKVAMAGAILLVIALLTGILLAEAMSGAVHADVAEVVAAHLNAFLGCLWLVALAVTLPWLRYGETGKRRLAIITTIAAYANWGVTTVKSFLHVTGVSTDHDRANNAVFIALTIFVVIPSFIGAIGWVYGLSGPKTSE